MIGGYIKWRFGQSYRIYPASNKTDQWNALDLSRGDSAHDATILCINSWEAEFLQFINNSLFIIIKYLQTFKCSMMRKRPVQFLLSKTVAMGAMSPIPAPHTLVCNLLLQALIATWVMQGFPSYFEWKQSTIFLHDDIEERKHTFLNWDENIKIYVTTWFKTYFCARTL